MLATPEIIRESAQHSRLQKRLPRWRKFPIYRANSAQDDFAAWPLTVKSDLRDNFPNNFLGERSSLSSLLESKKVELEHTSGSSEESTPVLFGNGWWNEQEERVLRLNRFVARILDENPGAKRATLTPPVCNGLVCFNNFTSKKARTAGSTLFVNQARIPFLLDDAELARMAEEIFEWSPQFLDLDPVHGVWFALFCERKGIRFPSVKFILCSYEFVSVVHRKILQRGFGVPLFNLYGSTETGHLLMENEHGEMKPNYQNAFYEIIEPDECGAGDLVITTLTNDFMPLVRYRIGDLAERCEKPYATTYRVHGRSRDALVRGDGRRITTLQTDECFAGISGIAHYRLTQKSDGICHLQIVSEREMPDIASVNDLTMRLEDLLQSPGRIGVEYVRMLPPLTSGKFRLTLRA